MNGYEDYRPSTGSEELDLTDILPAIQKLDRKLAKLQASTARLGPYDPELEDVLPAVAELDERVDQFAGLCRRLHRSLQRRLGAQTIDEDDDRQFKRRQPAVTKALSAPAEGVALLHDAAIALRSGCYEYGRWADQQRARLAAV